MALENPQIIAIDENYHIKDAKDNAKFLHKDNVDFLCKNINEEQLLNQNNHLIILLFAVKN